MRFLISLLTLFFISAELSAQQLDPTMWVPNGPVYATAKKNNTVYIGGTFDDVGPATGHGALIDSTTGNFLGVTPVVEGTIYSVISDKRGGWYIGGNFLKVQYTQRRYLAHIKPSGQLDMNWNPDPDGPVYCMTLNDSNRLFVGGHFGNVGVYFRYNLACVDTATGVPDNWAPFCDSTVFCMQLDANLGGIYIGGAFQNAGGGVRKCLARLDTTLGFVFGYPAFPQLDFNFALDGYVYALCMVPSGQLYVGGAFSSVSSNGRNKLCSFTTTGTGALTNWNPNANGNVYAMTEDVAMNRIFIGGAFTSYTLLPQPYIAAIDLAGNQVPINPSFNGAIHSIFIRDSLLYIGGDFTKLGVTGRKKIVALNKYTQTLTAWNPHLNNTVYAIAEDSARVFAGGSFTSIGGIDRNNMAAIDLINGTPTSWDPNVTGTVYAIEKIVDTLYIGGSFTKVGITTRKNLAAIDINTAALLPMNVQVTGIIKCLGSKNSDLFMGGYFTQVGTKLRNNLASINLINDSVNSFDPDVNGTVNALLIKNNKIYVGGYFSAIRNFTHNKIACVNLLTSIPFSNWDPNANNVVYSLAMYQNRIYAGGSFTNIGGQSRKYVAEIDTASGNASSWDPSPNVMVHSLFLNNDTLMIGGDFTSIETQARTRFAQYDLSNHSLTGWAPSFSSSVIHIAEYGGIVFCGGTFENADYLFHPDFAAFYWSLPQSHQEIKKQENLFSFYPNPSSSTITCNYTLEKNSRVALKLYDVTGKMKMILLDEKKNAGMNSDQVNIRELSNGIYFLQLETEDHVSTSKLIKID